MKIILLILAFLCIVFAAVLFNVNIPEFKPYKQFVWIPIGLGCLLFSIPFLLKDGSGQKIK